MAGHVSAVAENVLFRILCPSPARVAKLADAPDLGKIPKGFVKFKNIPNVIDIQVVVISN